MMIGTRSGETKCTGFLKKRRIGLAFYPIYCIIVLEEIRLSIRGKTMEG